MNLASGTTSSLTLLEEFLELLKLAVVEPSGRRVELEGEGPDFHRFAAATQDKEVGDVLGTLARYRTEKSRDQGSRVPTCGRHPQRFLTHNDLRFQA